MGVLAIIVVLQIVLIEVGGDAFQTTPMTGPQWGISLGLGLTSIPIGWVCRLIPVRSADDTKSSQSPRGSSSGRVTPVQIDVCCSTGEASPATVTTELPLAAPSLTQKPAASPASSSASK
jgi:hypothetical protein